MQMDVQIITQSSRDTSMMLIWMALLMTMIHVQMIQKTMMETVTKTGVLNKLV